ncbi:AAA family ATPase [Angustibacter luteus]|uniref:CpaE family protein n=1 Tax=Angustibacter luteus TaxID=658456 RepID=A0ABW1JHW6_9ACTN
MNPTVRVATAITGDDEPALVSGLATVPGIDVVRRCADVTELLACAASGVVESVVVSAALRGLDAEALDRLRLDGVGFVVLTGRDEPEAAARLARLGVEHVLVSGGPPSVVGQALLAAHRSPGPALGHGQPRAALARPVPLTDPEPLDPGVGRVVAVWGPTGAPGRTTVAIGLAAELAGGGASTLLVDGDTYGPSVAQSLGLLDESSGLAAAARAADRGSLDLATLAGHAPWVGERLRVLTGVTRPDRWPELRAGSVRAVLELARSLATWTVVDVGFCLEQDEELAFDTAAPRRNGATLSALSVADVVLAVGSADPVGLQRLVRGLGDLAELRDEPPVVVVNRLRAGPVGTNPGRRVRDALRRYADVSHPVLVVHDQASLDAAMLNGRTLAEHGRGSPIRQALQDLVLRLAAGEPDRPREDQQLTV